MSFFRKRGGEGLVGGKPERREAPQPQGERISLLPRIEREAVFRFSLEDKYSFDPGRIEKNIAILERAEDNLPQLGTIEGAQFISAVSRVKEYWKTFSKILPDYQQDWWQAEKRLLGLYPK